jgi:glycosyltransferase involved in cell wall biosynthesis
VYTLALRSVSVTIEKGGSPAVTVIMPAFNSARTLRNSAHSVLDQSARSLELIIVDDGSSDQTAESLRSWRRRTHGCD